MLLHPYHCPRDGQQLSELSLGILVCEKCDTQFVPSSKDGYMELTWKDTGPPQEDTAKGTMEEVFAKYLTSDVSREFTGTVTDGVFKQEFLKAVESADLRLLVDKKQNVTPGSVMRRVIEELAPDEVMPYLGELTKGVVVTIDGVRLVAPMGTLAKLAMFPKDSGLYWVSPVGDRHWRNVWVTVKSGEVRIPENLECITFLEPNYQVKPWIDNTKLVVAFVGPVPPCPTCDDRGEYETDHGPQGCMPCNSRLVDFIDHTGKRNYADWGDTIVRKPDGLHLIKAEKPVE